MRFNVFSSEVISSLEQLENTMLKKIGVTDSRTFFKPPPPHDLSPTSTGLDLNQLQKASRLLNKAVNNQWRVLIFGDYDCDGITSTAMLWEALYRQGLTSAPFIPDRERFGYGLSVTALESIWPPDGFDLVITVDNGIVAHEALAWLKKKKTRVLLTDHHQPDNTKVQADVVVHSTKLAGAGVVWFLIHHWVSEIADDYLDLAVLGTVADQVPLIAANRSLAVHGLKALQNTKRVSLQTLAQIAGIELKSITTNTIGYVLAPRINAVGRLSDPMKALRALLDRDRNSLTKRWQEIEDLNQERRDLTVRALNELESSLATSASDAVVVALGEWPEGLVGLIASRLVDLYHKPAIAVTTANEEMLKASCRSIPDVDITALLRQLPDDIFVSLGGHPSAAGFSLLASNWNKFLEHLLATANQQINPTLLTPQIEVLGYLDWSIVNSDILDVINKFAPFGSGNDQPIFAFDSVEIVDVKPVGQDQQHAQIQLRNKQAGQTIRSICWHYEDKQLDKGSTTHAAIKLKASSYREGDLDIELVTTSL